MPTLTASARDGASEPRVGTKKRALRSNKETDEVQKICRSGKLLDKKSPIQGNRGTSGDLVRQVLWGLGVRQNASENGQISRSIRGLGCAR
jgi:hypothetical protein